MSIAILLSLLLSPWVDYFSLSSSNLLPQFCPLSNDSFTLYFSDKTVATRRDIPYSFYLRFKFPFLLLQWMYGFCFYIWPLCTTLNILLTTQVFPLCIFFIFSCPTKIISSKCKYASIYLFTKNRTTITKSFPEPIYLNPLQVWPTYLLPSVAKLLRSVLRTASIHLLPFPFPLVQSQLGFLLYNSKEIAPVKLWNSVCVPSLTQPNWCSWLFPLWNFYACFLEKAYSWFSPASLASTSPSYC